MVNGKIVLEPNSFYNNNNNNNVFAFIKWPRADFNSFVSRARGAE